jgi:hypothetical protein
MSQDSRGFVGGIFTVAVLAYWVSVWLKVNFFLALAYVVVGIFLIAWVAFHSIALKKRTQAFVRRWEKCPHGIRSAKASCSVCLAKEQESQTEIERLYAERESQHRLRKNARALRQEEFARLCLAWQSSSAAYLKMDPRAFENGIAEVFRRLGYRVEQTPYTNDHGKDAIAWKDNKKYVIECKRYGEDGQTGRRDIQILKAAMHDESAHGGFFISTGRFTSTAIEYARQNRIELYDRTSLPILVNKAYGPAERVSPLKVICQQCGQLVLIEVDFAKDELGSALCPQSHLVTPGFRLSDLRVATSPNAPLCPKCDLPMKLVRGHRGEFWGCSQYPNCRASKKVLKSSRIVPA